MPHAPNTYNSHVSCTYSDHSTLGMYVLHGTEAVYFTLQNKCSATIWPGTLSGTGPLLINGGTRLKPGQSITIDVPYKWSGRFWARTNCKFDRTGKGTCATGDSGGLEHCGGAGGAPPVTLAEFTLDDKNFYDVSLVDGYNIPISIYPYDGTGDCKKVECSANLKLRCPKDLRVVNNGKIVACKSACTAYNTLNIVASILLRWSLW
ncbi:hypothetical protein GH714_003437 [Hevea brasiliensis]|uniref:Thaumatin-like protein n=1 Tax=Hevea brasiliensis TaxID=3981 RepID=A0A6A6KX94_HEVBR|nr:hypothetical protein GH714_003437 [Hevea brasiliensis]